MSRIRQALNRADVWQEQSLTPQTLAFPAIAGGTRWEQADGDPAEDEAASSLASDLRTRQAPIRSSPRFVVCALGREPGSAMGTQETRAWRGRRSPARFKPAGRWPPSPFPQWPKERCLPLPRRCAGNRLVKDIRAGSRRWTTDTAPSTGERGERSAFRKRPDRQANRVNSEPTRSPLPYGRGSVCSVRYARSEPRP